MDPTGVLTVVASTAGAVKAIAEAVKGVKSKVKGNAEAEEAVSTVTELVSTLQSRIIDLQTHILSLQESMGQLQGENVGLRTQIREKEERATDRKKYVRKQIGGAAVMVDESEPDIFYCASCFATDDRAIPLQPTPHAHRIFGSHKCPSCKTKLGISV